MKFMEDLGSYSVSLVPLDDVAVVEKEWLDLEARSSCSFFLSWTWIGTWLSVIEPHCDVLRVHFKEQLVGLALVTRSQHSAFNHFPSSRIHFHQKGNALCDQIWTEYNGMLSVEDHQNASMIASLRYLEKEFSDWDELVISAVTEEVAELMEGATDLTRQDLWQSPTFGVDLQQLKQLGSNYLDSLSRNTRYQIRRSLRLYQSRNNDTGLKLVFADSCAEALTYLDEVAPLHLDRWGSGLSESGFTNESFVAFHRELIRRGWPDGRIDFIKVKSGAKVIAYIYNFLYRGTVYFYLSGIAAETEPKLKPGLCSHALCIQHYLDKGYKYYDFMGGDDRYKASLGKRRDELYKITLQKDKLKFKVEDFLRSLKNRLPIT